MFIASAAAAAPITDVVSLMTTVHLYFMAKAYDMQ
jgi:hypothetical protein